jgi:hypothetical protein
MHTGVVAREVTLPVSCAAGVSLRTTQTLLANGEAVAPAQPETRQRGGWIHAKALVGLRRMSGPTPGDRDTAASLLDRRFRASTITSCVGTDGTDGRRDLDLAEHRRAGNGMIGSRARTGGKRSTAWVAGSGRGRAGSGDAVGGPTASLAAWGGYARGRSRGAFGRCGVILMVARVELNPGLVAVGWYLPARSRRHSVALREVRPGRWARCTVAPATGRPLGWS